MKINQNFPKDIDRVLNGTYPKGEMVYVCDTPELLQAIGMKNLPILMTQKHIHSCLAIPRNSYDKHSHGLDKKFMDALPYIMNNPAAVLNSQVKLDSIVLVTNALDYNHDPIIIAVKNDGIGMYCSVDITANILKSTYGKQGFFNFFNNAVQNNELIFYDKKNSHNLLDTVGIQCSKALINFDYNTIIHDISKKVNSFTQKIYLIDTEVYYLDDDELSLKQIKHGKLEQHVLSENRLDYIIDGKFVKNEEVTEDITTVKKHVALHNTKILQGIIQNAEYPSEFKEETLKGKLFCNDSNIYEIIQFDNKSGSAILKSSYSSLPCFHTINGFGANSDANNLRWSESSYVGEDIKQAFSTYFDTQDSEQGGG